MMWRGREDGRLGADKCGMTDWGDIHGMTEVLMTDVVAIDVGRKCRRRSNGRRESNVSRMQMTRQRKSRLLQQYCGSELL